MTKKMIFCLGISMLFVVGIAQGATLFYTNFNTPNSEIYSIDTSSGNEALIMTVNNVVFNGLATSNSSAEMFAINTVGNQGCLYRVNLNALSASLVGCAGIDIKELAFDRNHNVLYGTDYANLYTINTTTGAATLIGPHVATIRMYGLSYDHGTNTLYGIDPNVLSLYTINTSTGAATVAHILSSPVWATDIYVEPLSGIIYAVTIAGASGFYSIDKNTGSTTLIKMNLMGSLPFGLAAPAPLSPVSAPSLNEWGMIILIVLLGAGSVYYLRRRRLAL
jgi:hypothetical protein